MTTSEDSATNAREIELAAREVIAAWDSGDSGRSGRARKRLRETLAHVDAMNEQAASSPEPSGNGDQPRPPMTNPHNPKPPAGPTRTEDGRMNTSDQVLSEQSNSGRLKMAYADPPYPGQSFKHYRDHPDYAGEVDHAALIARLVAEYPDGWALSTSSPALRDLLPLCPADVRVMAWVKPFAAFKRNVRVAYAWEPIIVKVAERLPGARPTRDFVAESITMKRGLTGAKPERFCLWLFEAMGLRPWDALDDLFHGSGAVADAWAYFQQLPDIQNGQQQRMAV